MPDYEASLFNPPAPVVRVVLRDPDAGAALSDVLLLLDTGADVTLLPHASILAIGVSPLADLSYEVEGFDGSIRRDDRHGLSEPCIPRPVSRDRG